MLYTYSITPLVEDHFEERVADLISQHARGISTCPLFLVKLEPQGDPVWHPSEQYARVYRRYKERLDEAGVPSGFLLQSTFGHGNWTPAAAPYQKMEPINGAELSSYCPMDAGMLAYLCEELKVLAAEHPAVLMLDDDVRLVLHGVGACCACPLHMAEFNKRCGTQHTKETLFAHLRACGENDPLARAFVTLQQETLVHAVTRMREAVDSVDPTIQGVNCTSGDLCEAAIYTNPIWCGKNNPTIVRAPNGTYAPSTVKGISDTMRRAAVSGAKLRDHGIQYVLAECDTLPFNRYGKHARYLHTHYTASLLEGLSGAKHWITRTVSFEPNSGVAFREVLAKHAGFYEKIATLAKEITFVGANSAFTEQTWCDIAAPSIWRYHTNYFATKAFERLGLPFYFSNKRYGATFLEERIARDLPTREIEAMFANGAVFMSAEAAADLVARGYGALIGVDVQPFDARLGRVEGEAYDEAGTLLSQKQKDHKLLVPTSQKTRVLSYNYRRENGVLVNVSPAVTRFDRGEGKFSVVYCGTPDAKHHYTEGFAFLNETRKQQFISLLREAGELPVYLPSDNELCLRAGYVAQGRLLVAIFNLSYDPEERTELYLEKEPRAITRLDENGDEIAVTFQRNANGFYVLDVACEPLYPTLLLIEQ